MLLYQKHHTNKKKKTFRQSVQIFSSTPCGERMKPLAKAKRKSNFTDQQQCMCVISKTDMTSRNAVSSTVTALKISIPLCSSQDPSEPQEVRVHCSGQGLCSLIGCLYFSLSKCLSAVTGQRSVTLFSTAAAIC